MALVIPAEMLAACDIAEEATVTVSNKTLIVAAPQPPPPAEQENDDTLAHWANLPEAPEEPELQPRARLDAALREDPKPYGKPGDPAGA